MFCGSTLVLSYKFLCWYRSFLLNQFFQQPNFQNLDPAFIRLFREILNNSSQFNLFSLCLVNEIRPRQKRLYSVTEYPLI